MWEQLKIGIEASARAIGSFVNEAATLIGRVSLIAWDVLRPAVVFALNVLVAVILIFEEWGWRPLSAFVARLARFRLWAMAELWIAGLPPYGALLALGVPSAILIPAKLLGVYLLATGHFVTAAIVIVAAKLASTALIARIFLLTKPALMQIAWFALRLRRLRALAGSAVRARPQLVGVALRAHRQMARQATCAAYLELSAAAASNAVARHAAEAARRLASHARREPRSSDARLARAACVHRVNCRRPTRGVRRR